MGKMSLRNKSLKVNSRKTLAIALTVALAMATLGALLALAPAKAQGQIILSSSNLNPKKIVELDIRLPGVDVERVRIWVKDPTGEVIVGKAGDEFYAKKLATGRYIAYLGGPSAPDQGPAVPKVPISEAIGNVTYYYYKSLPTTSPGTVLTIEVLGYDVTTTISYAAVASTLTVDRTTVPVRDDLYASYRVTLTVTDQDLNYDPTTTESQAAGFFYVTVTLIKKETTGVTIGPETVSLSGSFSETAANSGTFKITLTVNQLIDALGPGVTKLDKGDLLIIEAASNIAGWGDGTYDDKELKDSKTLTAVYNYPKVSIEFTNQYLTITIASPDDNIKTGESDTLAKDVAISEYVSTTIPGSKFKETGANTGVFTYKLKVRWGVDKGIDTTKDIVYLKVGDREFTVKATYLDITASAKYTAVAPDVSIDRATAKVVVLSVTDPDLNNDPNTLERLELTSIATDGTMSFKKVKIKDEAELVLYTVKITDTKGNAIVPPSGYSPSFIETDVNSNTFKLMLPSQHGGTQLLKPGETYVITLTDLTGTFTKSVTVTVAEIKVELERATYPINLDKDIKVYVMLYDDRLNKDPAKIDPVSPETYDGVLKYCIHNPTVGKYINPDTGAWSDSPVPKDVTGLRETGPDTGVFKATITISKAVMSPKFIGAEIVVYKADEPDYKVKAKFDVYQVVPGDLSVDKTVVPINGTLVVTVYDPDANVDSAVKDSVSVDVYVDGVKKTVPWSLTETGVNTGKFTYNVSVYEIPDVKPGSTIKFVYTDKTPVRSPTATDFGTPITVSATVKVASFTGSLGVPKDWIGPYEIMTIRVIDPDLNMKPREAESVTISVLIEGFAESKDLTLTETGMNTGVFEGKFSLGWWATGDVKSILDPKTIRENYIGKRVTIMYVDAADETGSRRVNVATLTIKAVDAEISVDKEAVNLGQALTITVKNLDIAQNPKAEFRQVLLRSTTYPTGITFYASEVEPGVYQVKVTVVSLDAWTPGAPQIPAKLGDTITIEYKDPIAADGTEKLFTKTVVVGVPVERPVPASEQKFLDVTGAEKKVGKVGETVMLSAKVQNVDVVDREFTAVFQVKDENGAVVYIAWITAKLAPGTSMTPAVSWTPTVAGTYTVEVLVVKSIAEPTPYSDKISAPFTVQ